MTGPYEPAKSRMGKAPTLSNLRERLMDGSLLILLAALLVLAAAY